MNPWLHRPAHLGAAALSFSLLACGRTRSPQPIPQEAPAVEEMSRRGSGPDASDALAGSSVSGERDADVPGADPPDASPTDPRTASLDAARPTATVAWVPFAQGRTSFVVPPIESRGPPRLLAMLHGVGTPPSDVCGAWKEAAAHRGLLVCPVGNTTVHPDGTGGPTWEEPFAAMDADLEASIAAVRRRPHLEATRDGEVLAGFSRGAYVAVILAVRHPGRWPFLILNEADVDLTLPMVREARVRSVALIAGEWGTQLAGERRTVEALASQGYPARLWVMPRVGHAYSPDIDRIMGEALDFVLAHEHDAAP